MVNLWGDDSDNTGSSSQRQYTSITRQEFEEFLATTRPEWELVDEAKSKEHVYEASTRDSKRANIVLRLYSSIDERTDKCRDKGSDAIRLLVFDTSTGRPVGGRTKTLRIKTWEKNLRKKIESVWGELDQYINICDECNSVMVIRDGKYGEFYSCNSYPDCDYTENIN